MGGNVILGLLNYSSEKSVFNVFFLNATRKLIFEIQPPTIFLGIPKRYKHVVVHSKIRFAARWR
jgi:hypothetical protein